MAVTVKTLNGPFAVAGGVKLVDGNGKIFVESAIDPFYLCRCGQSHNNPYATAPIKSPDSKRTKPQNDVNHDSDTRSFRLITIRLKLTRRSFGVLGSTNRTGFDLYRHGWK